MPKPRTTPTSSQLGRDFDDFEEVDEPRRRVRDLDYSDVLADAQRMQDAMDEQDEQRMTSDVLAAMSSHPLIGRFTVAEAHAFARHIALTLITDDEPSSK